MKHLYLVADDTHAYVVALRRALGQSADTVICDALAAAVCRLTADQLGRAAGYTAEEVRALRVALGIRMTE